MNHLGEHLDDYVDGALDPATRAACDAHLAGCGSCRADVEKTRRIVGAARGLAPEALPRRDLWPAIDRRIAPRRVWPVVAAFGGVGLLAAACAGVIGGLWWNAAPTPDVAAIQAQRAEGDWPGASAAVSAAVAANPTAAALEDAAYDALLRGHLDDADALLAAIPDPTPQVQLRRAIVAMRAGDLDAVARHAGASGLPAGELLAAEVALTDGEDDAAIARLERAKRDGDAVVAGTAAAYLALLGGETADVALAEATAMWAVGERAAAAEIAAEVVGDTTAPGRDERLLLWAGRAVTSGRAVAATALLDGIASPPEGQAWRIVATRAMVDVAEGRVDDALAAFDALESGGAPEDGVADARATAAALAPDPAAALALLDGQQGPAAARALAEAGDRTAAAARADGAMARWLRGE